MATRKPVSVLPEPVGEATSTSSPLAMWGQAAVWGGVGPGGKRGRTSWPPPGGTATRAVAVGHALYSTRML